MKILVYDFDKTIYDGDSTIDFYLFCLRKNKKIIKRFPNQLKFLLLFYLNKVNKEKFKEEFFVFLNDIDNIDEIIEEFWQKNQNLIKKWFNAKDKTIVISASPEFLLEPICKKLKIDKLIATKVNKLTGKFDSKNCYGEEKVLRFKQAIGESVIDEFYSDSESDRPLKDISIKAFKVKGNKVLPW